jgi:hypothetical protein
MTANYCTKIKAVSISEYVASSNGEIPGA